MYLRLCQILIIGCGIMAWIFSGNLSLQNRLFSAELAMESPVPTPIADQTYPPQPTSPLSTVKFYSDEPEDPDWRTNWILAVAEGRKPLATKLIESSTQRYRYFTNDGRWLETKISNALIATTWDWSTMSEGESVALPFLGRSGRRINDFYLSLMNIASPFHSTVSWQPNGNHSALTILDSNRPCCVWIMDQSSGQQVAELSVATGLNALAYSPDGRWLAITADNTVILYDSTTYLQAAIYQHKRSEIVQLRFSPDGKWLLTADADSVEIGDTTGWIGNYHLWEVAGSVHHADLLSAPVIIANDDNVIFTPDGTMLLLHQQGELRMVESQETVFSYTVARDQQFFFAFSPNGRLFARTDSACSCTSVWDTSDGEQVAKIKPTITVNLMVFSPDNQTIAIGGTRPVDGAGDTQPKELVHATELWNTLNGKKLLDLDYEVDADIGSQNQPLDWLTAQIFHVEWSPWGKWLLSVGGEGKIWVWDATTGDNALLIDYFEEGVRPNSASDLAVRFAPHGTAIVARQNGQPIKIYYAQ